MADQVLLPKFRKPPVSEVAVGVQFRTPELTPVHLGLYYQRVRTRFPVVQVLPPLAPVFELFGPAPTLSLSFPVAGPRMWFITSEGTALIQLQTGRLFFNWRGGVNGGLYPHFDAVREEFLRALDELEVLAIDENLGSVSADQCEVVYVNPLPANATGVSVSEPERIFRTLSGHSGSEWSKKLEDVALNVRYRFDDADGNPFGRLTVALTSGWAADGSLGFQLELTARGRPLGPGREGIIAFQDYAHDAIVRCFTGLTTPDMHERWERYQ